MGGGGGGEGVHATVRQVRPEEGTRCHQGQGGDSLGGGFGNTLSIPLMTGFLSNAIPAVTFRGGSRPEEEKMMDGIQVMSGNFEMTCNGAQTFLKTAVTQSQVIWR